LTFHPAHRVLPSMEPVVRIEPNGSQTLLLFDNSRKDLENNGWLVFIQRFEGFNLSVSQQFTLTFDGCKAKVGDIQLELNEEFMSSATGLPVTGKRWFKNSKVDEVSWSLLFTSRKIVSCDKGMPITTLKPRWHDLLAIVKQFVTCEGRYGLVFRYHLRLLMNFIGYHLNMPHYLLRSLYKMSKRFKREKADSSLFHHGLIKLIIVHRLSLSGDSWQDFLSRNDFATLDSVQVDKVVVMETLVGPAVPFHILLPPVKPSDFPDIDLPDTITNPCTKDKTEVVNKPMRKKGRGDNAVNSKGKKNARWISRCARNKPKKNVDQNPIVLSEDSDSEIEHFLTEEYPYSHGLCSMEPYDYVSNLPPCLKNDPNYPGIKLYKETPGNLNKPSPVMPKPDQSSCIQCNAWLECYYTDVPLLQSKIKLLEERVTVLSKENDRLQANEKKQKTTGSIVFINVEAAMAFVNSKLS
jgi:hypothetical protein